MGVNLVESVEEGCFASFDVEVGLHIGNLPVSVGLHADVAPQGKVSTTHDEVPDGVGHLLPVHIQILVVFNSVLALLPERACFKVSHFFFSQGHVIISVSAFSAYKTLNRCQHINIVVTNLDSR